MCPPAGSVTTDVLPPSLGTPASHCAQVSPQISSSGPRMINGYLDAAHRLVDPIATCLVHRSAHGAEAGPAVLPHQRERLPLGLRAGGPQPLRGHPWPAAVRGLGRRTDQDEPDDARAVERSDVGRHLAARGVAQYHDRAGQCVRRHHFSSERTRAEVSSTIGSRAVPRDPKHPGRTAVMRKCRTPCLLTEPQSGEGEERRVGGEGSGVAAGHACVRRGGNPWGDQHLLHHRSGSQPRGSWTKPMPELCATSPLPAGAGRGEVC